MIRRLLLGGGMLSSLWYLVSIDGVARRQYPGYHRYTSQMVSELFAVGSPTRRVQVWLSTVYNLLVLGFAAGIWLSAGRRRSMRVAAITTAGYGAASTAGALWAPMDVRGTLNSRRDRRHIAVTGVMSAFTAVTIVSSAWGRGRTFRVYSLVTLALAVVFGVLTGLLARPMPRATPGVGLAERVNIYASMAWLAALGAALWREPGRE